MKEMEIKIKEELETVIEGTWKAGAGADEKAVIDAVEMFLAANGYDFDRQDISVFGCQWVADIWR